MGLEKHVSTPTAILIGCAMIAVGLFFGLRRDERELPPAPSPKASLAPAAPPAPPPKEAPPAPPPVPSAPRDELVRQASKALDAQRPQLVARCWKPALVKQAQPATAKFVFIYTFDAQGQQIGRGVAEDRATARPDLTACILGMLQPLSIQPPGANVQVEVPFTLP